MDDPISRMLGMHAWSWQWQAMVRLAVAAALGACIGVEREHRGRAAGFRTLLLVALGSALAMVVSIHFGNVYASATSPAIRVDPARVAYGVMVGIGFLGAGAIMRNGTGVRGLTTAAALWCTAAIGLACGFGMFTVALAAAALVLAALLGLFHLDRMIPTRSVRFLSVTLPLSGEDTARKFADWVKARGVPIIDLQCERDLVAKTETLTFEISLPGHVPPASLLDIVEKAPQASRISIR